MDIDRVKAIVKCLASGIDPRTGEPLAPGTPLEEPDVVRALFLAHEALGARSAPAAARKRPSRPARSGRTWDEREDEELSAAYGGGLPVADIASRLGRSRGAIEARLVKLGKLSLDEVARPPRFGARL